MSRYYRNSVFWQTSKGLVSTQDFVKTRKYFYCSYFYILCAYEFIELNEILFCSIPELVHRDLDMSRYYIRNSVFLTNSQRGCRYYIGFCRKLESIFIVKTRKYFYCSFLHIMCLWVYRIEWDFILLDSEQYRTRYEPILQELSFLTNLKGVS